MRRTKQADAAIHDQAPGAPFGRRHVRPGRRCRALSRVRAAVHALKVRQRTPSGEGVETIVADMTVVVQARARELSQPRHARPAEAANPGRVSARPVQPHAEPLDLPADRRGRLRGRVLHRLRVSQPHAGHADGRDVRRSRSAASPRPSRRAPIRSTAAQNGLALGFVAGCQFASASPAPPAPTAGAPRRGRCRQSAARDGSRRPPRDAAAKCTSPTGLSAVPPPGPAMPVIDTARSAWAWPSAPLAIASAVSRLTAP